MIPVHWPAHNVWYIYDGVDLDTGKGEFLHHYEVAGPPTQFRLVVKDRAGHELRVLRDVNPQDWLAFVQKDNTCYVDSNGSMHFRPTPGPGPAGSQSLPRADWAGWPA